MRKITILFVFVVILLVGCGNPTNNNKSNETKETINNSTLTELINLTKMDIKDSLCIVKKLSTLGYALGDCISGYSYTFITTQYGDLEKLKSIRGGANLDLCYKKISSIYLESRYESSRGFYKSVNFVAPSYKVEEIMIDVLSVNKDKYTINRKTEIDDRVNKVVETIFFLPTGSNELPVLIVFNSEGYSMLSVSPQ